MQQEECGSWVGCVCCKHERVPPRGWTFGYDLKNGKKVLC